MHHVYLLGKYSIFLLGFIIVGCGESESPKRSDSDLNGVSLSIENLNSRDADTRLFHAQLLGQMGPDAKEAMPALEALQDDSDSRVQKAASEALKKIRESDP